MKRSVKRKPQFMVHKHRATRLHYDVRLEIDGKLTSWALYSLPFSPSQSIVAIQVSDHPFWYRHFEGVISDGHYGAGPVIVWDKGLYTNFTRNPAGKILSLKECIKQGILFVTLYGHKMRGNYAFIRTSKKQRWLMIKLPDSYTIPPRKKPKNWNKSIKSNQTIQQLMKK